MSYTPTLHLGDGVQTDWDVRNEYISRDHIFVSVNGVRTGDPESLYEFAFVTDAVIRVTSRIGGSPVPLGTPIFITRETPIDDPVIQFTGASSLSAESLNENSLYLRFALQESFAAREDTERFYLGAFASDPIVNNQGLPLEVGVQYFNNQELTLKTYTETGWFISNPGPVGPAGPVGPQGPSGTLAPGGVTYPDDFTVGGSLSVEGNSMDLEGTSPTFRMVDTDLGGGSSFRQTYTANQGVQWVDQEGQGSNPVFRWALGIEGDVMRLHSNGLGVGVTSGFPQAKLHVIGDTILDGDVEITGGLKHALSVPENAFLYAAFREHDDRTIDLFTSVDGTNFKRINMGQLRHGGGQMTGKDPAICWFNDEWWIFITNPVENVRDFAVYKSTDLTTWRRYDPFMGTGTYSSTQPMPGGNHVADSIWAPEPFIMNDTLYVLTSIRFGSNPGDDNFRLYYSECTDPVAMTFAAPVLADFGADNELSMIDWAVIEEPDGTLYAVAAGPRDNNDFRVYQSTNLSGPWTPVTQVSTDEVDVGFEAPIWTKFYTTDYPSGNPVVKYRVIVDNNRTHPLLGTPVWHLVGRAMYFEADSPAGPYTGPHPIKTASSSRHGTVVNLKTIGDAKAVQSVMMAAAFGSPNELDDQNMRVLSDGADFLWPKEGFHYYVEGSDQCDLTLGDGPANKFFIGVFSSDVLSSLTLNGSGNVVGSTTVSVSNRNRWVEMVRAPDGTYAPVGTI